MVKLNNQVTFGSRVPIWKILCLDIPLSGQSKMVGFKITKRKIKLIEFYSGISVLDVFVQDGSYFATQECHVRVSQTPC
jgi:hypothetical protein